ncbi:hypothetical protein H9Q09_21505 [Aurantimonas sp. DM33-3]|uniref:hypothetical protein n=1 Tax=Aurantimonas sp. DM33-3 TaxID=2766955 RepID=UPI001651FFB2|nr:hypothetical protein [Aurantimonas sp. DM33-3]MBC6718761.1 hypothetical protein [Aurantimonas sp. DM33-3]
MSPEQADRLAAIWVELSGVVGNIESAKELFAFDRTRAHSDDPVPFNIEASLTEALDQVRYIQSQVRDMAAIGGVLRIVDEFDAERLARTPSANGETSPI